MVQLMTNKSQRQKRMKFKKKIANIITVILVTLLVISVMFMTLYRHQIATLRSVNKIDDYPIYTMDYEGTYWFDDFMNTEGMTENFNGFFNQKLSHGFIRSSFANNSESSGFCTCFVCENENGDILFCRNMESTSVPYPSIVVTTHDGTYATVGTAFLTDRPEGTFGFMRDMLTEPYFIGDGMNEAGLAISILTVPAAIVPQNDGTPLLGAEQICRLILNEAGTVEEAVALFDEFTMRVSMTQQLSFCHFFIADRSGAAVVVELHDGIVDVIEPIHDNYMTVTNFYLSSDTLSGSGQTRYNTVEAVLEESGGVMSEHDAFELLGTLDDPFIHPEWTCVYNLTTGEMSIMPNGQLDHIHEIDYSF